MVRGFEIKILHCVQDIFTNFYNTVSINPCPFLKVSNYNHNVIWWWDVGAVLAKVV